MGLAAVLHEVIVKALFLSGKGDDFSSFVLQTSTQRDVIFCIATVQAIPLGCIGWSLFDDAFLNVDIASTSWVVIGSLSGCRNRFGGDRWSDPGDGGRLGLSGLAPVLWLVFAGSPDECSGVP